MDSWNVNSTQINSICSTKLKVTINSLLEAAADKDETVRNTVSASLRRLAKKYAIQILRNACLYRQINPKMTNGHLMTILSAMERICEEQSDELDDAVVKQLVLFSVEEMTRCLEYQPSVQFPASNILVALGQKNCSIVMGGLVMKLEPGVVPHYTVLHTMANLASANVAGFVPFIKATLDMIIPMLSSIRNDPIRQVFSFGAGHCDKPVDDVLLGTGLMQSTLTI